MWNVRLQAISTLCYHSLIVMNEKKLPDLPTKIVYVLRNVDTMEIKRTFPLYFDSMTAASLHAIGERIFDAIPVPVKLSTIPFN